MLVRGGIQRVYNLIMEQKLTKAQEAKLAAFKDIAEEGTNCIIFEKAICEFVGIPDPDFRKFNGGHNKKK